VEKRVLVVVFDMIVAAHTVAVEVYTSVVVAAHIGSVVVQVASI
jgi:hypothetical protein